MVLKGFPNIVAQGKQYNIGEKPTVMLCTNISRHEGTPKQKQGTLKLSLNVQNIWTKSSGPYLLAF